jgi:putative NIF3 family GTP cyclohydrolase 1 type 2
VRLTRRSFVRAAAGSLLVPRAGFAQSPAPSMTAAQVAERIRSNAGMAWREKTIDGFKAGNPETVVTGVATTVMATRRVLARAVELGRNLIVTQEPVFYNANDEPGNRASDANYLAKKAYVEKHGLVVFRFADHWNARQPDPRVSALAHALSWEGPGTNGVFAIREMTLSALAAHLRERLQIRGGLRTVGAPDMRVRSALLLPGTTDVPGVMARLKDADVVVAGEPREWEVVPYILDTVTAQSDIRNGREAGANKALLSVGRVVSEEPGMKACAEWLKTLLPEVPVDAIPVGDPYWSPLA